MLHDIINQSMLLQTSYVRMDKPIIVVTGCLLRRGEAGEDVECYCCDNPYILTYLLLFPLFHSLPIRQENVGRILDDQIQHYGSGQSRSTG